MIDDATMTTAKLESHLSETVRAREQFIDKWFADTAECFEANVKEASAETERRVDCVLIAALNISRTYCRAIFSLLAGEIRLPTRALLRILFDLSAKLWWCLATGDGGSQPSPQSVGERVERWRKSTIEERKKLLKKLIPMATGAAKARMEEDLSEDEYTYEALKSIKSAPKVGEIFENSPPSQREIYVRLYSEFNNAVHLDLSSLCKRIRETPGELVVACDSEEPLENLAQYCAIDMYLTIRAIRTYYGWDIEGMTKEFQYLTKKPGSLPDDCTKCD